MKRFRQLYIIATTVLLALAACTPDANEWGDQDNRPGEGTTTPDDGLVSLKVRIRPAENNTTAKARTRWQDSKADDDEMMNIWTVIVCDAASGNVIAAHTCRPAERNSDDAQREEDDIFRLPKGTYRFYSFANISPTTILDLLGISTTPAASGTRAERDNQGQIIFDDPLGEENEYPDDAVNTYGSDATGQTPTNIAPNLTPGTIYDLMAAVKAGAKITADGAKAVNVGIDARGFDPSNIGTKLNNFGEYGIPMSNVQQFTVTDDDNNNKNLIVVRAYAKIQLRLYNETGSPVTISDVKLSDITRSIEDNYKLLPSITSTTGWDNMEPTHGDIQPNLNKKDEKGVFHYKPTTDATDATDATYVTVPAANTFSSKNYQTITFYVNESAAPLNHFGRFYLGLSVRVGNNDAEYRYALIDDENASEHTGTWDYIARNDYRIIPLVIDDYQLDIIPYDFPAIGVFPASVKGEDGQFTINFHDYGHFHLVPVVKKVSTNTVIPFVSAAPTTGDAWGLVGNDWASSWTTYDSFGGTFQDTGNYDGFYKNETPSPAKDYSETGGIPVLDTSTHWNGCNDAATTNTPYIFGYIEKPGSLTSDKTIYHEFKIQLYNGTEAYRQKMYRLYMILDTEQMDMTSPSAARRPSCSAHGH